MFAKRLGSMVKGATAAALVVCGLSAMSATAEAQQFYHGSRSYSHNFRGYSGVSSYGGGYNGGGFSGGFGGGYGGGYNGGGFNGGYGGGYGGGGYGGGGYGGGYNGGGYNGGYGFSGPANYSAHYHPSHHHHSNYVPHVGW